MNAYTQSVFYRNCSCVKVPHRWRDYRKTSAISSVLSGIAFAYLAGEAHEDVATPNRTQSILRSEEVELSLLTVLAILHAAGSGIEHRATADS